MNITFRIISACLGLAVLYVTAECDFDISLAGFPDGHVTAYEKAVAVPFKAFCWEAVLVSLYFFWVTFSKATGIRRRLAIGIAVLVIGVVAPAYGVRYYYKDYLQLDTGTGG